MGCAPRLPGKAGNLLKLAFEVRRASPSDISMAAKSTWTWFKRKNENLAAHFWHARMKLIGRNIQVAKLKMHLCVMKKQFDDAVAPNRFHTLKLNF